MFTSLDEEVDGQERITFGDNSKGKVNERYHIMMIVVVMIMLIMMIVIVIAMMMNMNHLLMMILLNC